jgi:cohesin loading factor subunit SCC2
MVDDFCRRAEAPEEEEEGAEGPVLLPLAAIKDVINEIINSRSKKFLNEVPLDSLNRLLNVLDHQIKCAQCLSIDANENVNLICYYVCFHKCT